MSRAARPLALHRLLSVCVVFFVAASVRGAAAGGPPNVRQRLKVSDNKRFLVRDDGSPFFYLGDTAWELFHRLNREDAELYLKDRAGKRFTVIQAVVLAEFNALTEPNPYGELPLMKDDKGVPDPSQPNDKYFEHVDFVVDKAAELGMFVGMLPTWGDKVNKKWGIGPEIFTPANAEAYGEYLGRRYTDKPIIWILGGDRPVETDAHLEIWRAMARGIRKGDGGRHLMTYHTMGGQSSSEKLHDEAWLDFNMLQSGHGARDIANGDMIAKDYAREPAKPCIDGEPCYEDHPVNWDPKSWWFTEYDVRKACYWALFAGAHGHTYGCHDVWQFLSDERPAVSHARTPWKEAIHLPGAGQVQHARALLESRPFLTRVPDQSIIKSDAGSGGGQMRATRDAERSYLMVYMPTRDPVTVDLGQVAGKRVRAWWFDPTSGQTRDIGEMDNPGAMEFWAPPIGENERAGPGDDWVLVVDDAKEAYPPPGTSP